LFLVSTVACTKVGELRKVITVHFGSSPPLPAGHVECDIHIVARGM
jgi:hypothetical protein